MKSFRYFLNEGKKLTGYKVMPIRNGKIGSGANSRLNLDIKKGKTISMPGNGIYVSLDKQYVLDYYAGLADEEVLVTFEFDSGDITTGNITDKETEIPVKNAFVKDVQELDEGELVESKKYYKGVDKEDIDDRKAQFKRQTKKSDSSDSAYKDAPGDEEAREEGKVKTSKHTKKYNKLYKKESVNEDKKPEGLNGSKIDDAAIEKALKKKKEESGVDLDILRTIMKRGMAAWKTGHRPGATQQQWGYARINSFLTKSSGTWGKADKDMATEVRKRGQDKNLKS